LDYHGLGLRVSTLYQVTITNDGTGTPTRGNYIVKALAKNGRMIRTARIENWARKSKPALALLSAALQEMGYHKLT
jgi:hypothetical protein